MQLPVFSEAIRKCDAVLKPRGVNIIDVITSKDKKTFDNILNSFVGIAAIQVSVRISKYCNICKVETKIK